MTFPTRPLAISLTGPNPAPSASGLTRRAALFSLAGMLGTTALPSMLRAQEKPTDAAPQKFDFDALTETMRNKASAPDSPIPALSDFLATLKYDDYVLIQFWPKRARWNYEGSEFRLHAFHVGWLFKEPVHIFEVENAMATEMVFSTDDFDYRGDLKERAPKDFALPGVAGFKLNFPLNRADLFDEVVSFLGASYFRALGQGNAYGLSARGLAINSGLSTTEEFPRFNAFWLEKPAPGARHVVVHAALESASVTGAYRFVITPGVETVMDVTARLFFRNEVEQLGIAPLTSMFLFAENNRERFDDFRPQVHDSNGLRIVRENGDVIWRALTNPEKLGSSYMAETRPKSFGLHQRDRDFASYQDAAAHYQDRPSLDVEPVGDWGAGVVRLVEIPSDLEIHDNIAAFWVPDAPIKAGEAREFAYRLRWGKLPVPATEDRAIVGETRVGRGGAAGLLPEDQPDWKKFVVDFRGGMLSRLPADDEKIKPEVTVVNGKAEVVALSKIEGEDLWRLAIDISAEPGAVVELAAHVSGYESKLTEIWMFQWMKP